MSEIEKSLKQASDMELIDELRLRGMHVTTFSSEDMEENLLGDDEVTELNLDDGSFGGLLEAAFETCSYKIGDILSERGNQYLADMWDMEKPGVLAEIRQQPKTK